VCVEKIDFFVQNSVPIPQIWLSVGLIICEFVRYMRALVETYLSHITSAACTHNPLINWIIRLLLSLLRWPKVILQSGGHCTWQSTPISSSVDLSSLTREIYWKDPLHCNKEKWLLNKNLTLMMTSTRFRRSPLYWIP